MSTARGLVNSTITFSAVDGPGNRFVVFMQGCNFNCITCHNPYTITVCTDCGVCVSPCPEEALSILDGPVVVVDRAACTACDICIDVCPTDSTPLATWRSIADLIAEIRPAAPFLSGITVSGGEATLQADFVSDLFRAIKADPELEHLTTLVDSNGSAPLAVWERLLDVMDGAMIDLKAIDDDVHVRLTARGNADVLRSIEFLAERGKLEEVRLLIVPGYNDAPDANQRTARWLREVDPDVTIKIIGYRSHGVRVEASHIPDAERGALDGVASVLAANGLTRLSVV
jgi:YjjW family glycine radical enzyme activase